MFKKIHISLLFAMLPLCAHAAYSTEITGCEAEDMAISAQEMENGVWRGEKISFGEWSILPIVKIQCADGRCLISYEATVTAEGVVVSLPEHSTLNGFNPHTGQIFGNTVVLSAQPNAGGVTRTARGKLAESLYASVLNDPRSFKQMDGLKLVHMNYGYIGRINIRVRTEITCASDKDCRIVEDVVVFIPYSEVDKCEGGTPAQPIG